MTLNFLQKALYTLSPFIIASMLGCSPSTPPSREPTPTPTPHPLVNKVQCYRDGEPQRLSIDNINPARCTMDGKDVLIFDMPRHARIGDTVNFRVYVDSSVHNGSSAKVKYTKEKIKREPGRYDDTVNTEMLTLAEVPVNREVTLKFNPGGAGSYKFFLPGVTFFEPSIRWPKSTSSSVYENEGVIGTVCFGRPAQISVKSDVRETVPNSSVLLSVVVSPPTGEYGSLEVKVNRDGVNVNTFTSDSKTSKYLANWIPSQPGVYDIVAKGLYDCLFDGHIPTTSNVTKVSVRPR